MTEDKCLVCGAGDWEKINTYKHRWYSGNATACLPGEEIVNLSSPLTRAPIDREP